MDQNKEKQDINFKSLDDMFKRIFNESCEDEKFDAQIKFLKKLENQELNSVVDKK